MERGEKEEGVEKVSRCFFTVVVPPFFFPNEKCCLDALAGERGGRREGLRRQI